MTESFDAETARHLSRPPTTPATVDPAELDRPYERVSADGAVTATVNGLTLVVESVVVHRTDDPEALVAAVVEAVNAALEAAEAGAGPSGLDEAVAARVAEMDKQLDQISNRLDSLSARLDQMLRG